MSTSRVYRIGSVKIVDLPTRAAYERWAPTYDLKPNPLATLDHEVLSGYLRATNPDLSGKRALDLGCGTDLLARAGAEVTAVDFSTAMLDLGIAKAGEAHVEFMVHDLSDPLPFSDAAFDIVISTLVLEHIESLGPVFREMHRVCAPGGWLYVSDHHPYMRLKGHQAQFSDRTRGEEIRPRCFSHQVSTYVMSVLEADLRVVRIEELFGSEGLAQRFPKTETYIGWPMLLALTLER